MLYETARLSYTMHCRAHTSFTPFPATLTSLASWISAMGNRQLRAKTIKNYMSGIRSLHIDRGYDDLELFRHPVLQRIVAGIKRKNGDPDTRERLPITRDLLLKLLATLDQANQAQATLHAAYCLAFAAFLRAGEITYSQSEAQDPNFSDWHVTRRSVHLHPNKLYLSLPSSKTDPFRRGITLTIAATGDDACAVSSLRNLFFRFPLPPTAPLFQTFNNSFSREYFISALRSGLRGLGIDGNYSGHSFRRGAATSAQQAGLTKEEIQLLGRWKSDSWQLYIQTHESQLISTSSRFQCPPTSLYPLTT